MGRRSSRRHARVLRCLEIRWDLRIRGLSHGNRLAGGEVRVRAIEDSPIPPGYFAGICRKDGQAAKVESVSSPEKIRAYVESGSWKQADLLELLYCKDGCHHGDGVQTE